MHAPFVNTNCLKLLVFKTMTPIIPPRDFKRKNYVVLSVLYLNRSETIKRLSLQCDRPIQTAGLQHRDVTSDDHCLTFLFKNVWTKIVVVKTRRTGLIVDSATLVEIVFTSEE